MRPTPTGPPHRPTSPYHTLPDPHRHQENRKKEYTISTFPDTAAALLALSQNHADIDISTAIGLEYQVSQSHGQLTYLGKLPNQAEHIGFALKKGSALARPLQRAIQELIDNGTYAKILRKWKLSDAGITRSLIDPPGLR